MEDTKKNKVIVFLLYLLAFASVLYLFEAVQSIIMAVTSLFLLFQYNPKNPFFSLKKTPFILSFLILFGFNIFYYTTKSFQVIANSFLLFIIPLFSVYLYESSFFRKNKEKIILVYCFCLSLISIFIIYFYINDIPNHHFNWYFARFNLENTIHIHGTYISLWIGVAILFVIDFLARNKKLKPKFKIGFVFILILLSSSLIVINARMILYSTVFLSGLSSYFYFYKKGVNKKLILILVLLLSSGVLFLSQRYQDDIQFLNKNSIENSSRYTICYCSLQVISQSHFLGTNNGLVQEKLNNCYTQYGFNDMSKENLNSHNQYLDYFLKGGFLLFIAFISTLFIKLWISFKRKSYLFFSITFLFVFSFLTENILVRQYGIYIYLFCDILFLGSILSNKNHRADEVEKYQSGY